MKTSHFLPHHLLYATAVLLINSALVSPVAHAQTFTGQEKLTELPTSFEVYMYPVISRYATIRININNQSSGPVRIQIYDQQEHVFYDEFSNISRYRQYFDLSAMPSGIYTVRYSKPFTVYTQQFRIESPKSNRIVMLPKIPPTDTLPDQDKQMVSF